MRWSRWNKLYKSSCFVYKQDCAGHMCCTCSYTEGPRGSVAQRHHGFWKKGTGRTERTSHPGDKWQQKLAERSGRLSAAGADVFHRKHVGQLGLGAYLGRDKIQSYWGISSVLLERYLLIEHCVSFLFVFHFSPLRLGIGLKGNWEFSLKCVTPFIVGQYSVALENQILSSGRANCLQF